MTQQADIRKIEKEGVRIKKQQERLEAKRLKLAAAKDAHATAMESVIVARLHESGLMQLPLTQLLEGIKSLGAKTEGQVAENQETSLPVNEENVRVPEASGSVQNSHVDRKLIEVAVKISSHVSDKKRSVLETAGLRWNGKLGLWKAKVDETTLAILREHFSDRVTVKEYPGLEVDEGGLDAVSKPSPSELSPTTDEVPSEPPEPAPDAVAAPVDAGLAMASAAVNDADDSTHVETGAASALGPFKRPPIGFPRRT